MPISSDDHVKEVEAISQGSEFKITIEDGPKLDEVETTKEENSPKSQIQKTELKFESKTDNNNQIQRLKRHKLTKSEDHDSDTYIVINEKDSPDLDQNSPDLDQLTPLLSSNETTSRRNSLMITQSKEEYLNLSVTYPEKINGVYWYLVMVGTNLSTLNKKGNFYSIRRRFTQFQILFDGIKLNSVLDNFNFPPTAWFVTESTLKGRTVAFQKVIINVL